MSSPTTVMPRTLSLEELIDAANAAELQIVFEGEFDDAEMETFRSQVETREFPEAKIENPPSPSQLRYQLLRFLIDDERNRLMMQAVQDRRRALDRGHLVLKLWRKLADSDRAYIQNKHHSVVYHERRLFEWFVDQYDLIRARRVYTAKLWLAAGLQFLPGLAVVAAFLLAHAPVLALGVIAVGYLLPILVWFAWTYFAGRGDNGSGPSTLDFIQSLVPRLAGTAAAGAALMVSSDELISFFRNGMDFWRSLLLLVPAIFYLGLEVQQRARPRLTVFELAKRVGNVVFLALPHAAAIVFLILPAIRRSLKVTGGQLSAETIFVFTTAVFTSGLVLNAIWAQEPITKPL